MKITRIKVYQVDLLLHEGSYKWSGGKSVEVFDSTVVAIETNAGFTGYGEVCPLGPFYLPAYAAGARAVPARVAPAPGALRVRPYEHINSLHFFIPKMDLFFLRSVFDRLPRRRRL